MESIRLARGRILATIEKNQVEDCSVDDDGQLWSLEKFLETFQVDIVKWDKNERPYDMEFDLIDIDASIVNAFRRIIMSELPTMGIEKVFINYNTSIFQDDFLAHRLGLIPIKADPRMFEYRKSDTLEANPKDTVELTLQVKCSKNLEAAEKSTIPEEIYTNRNVYSKDIIWSPVKNQEELFSDPIKPVHDDILIAKLSPGQEIDLKLQCYKGIGRDHAKFSPVSTVYYRLLPVISLEKEIAGEDAVKLQSCFSKGVIDVVKKKGQLIAKVGNPRYDSLSRNFYRFPEFEKVVKMSLKKNHFIFKIESTGVLMPEVLFLEACNVLSQKCKDLIKEVQQLLLDS